MAAPTVALDSGVGEGAASAVHVQRLCAATAGAVTQSGLLEQDKSRQLDKLKERLEKRKQAKKS